MEKITIALALAVFSLTVSCKKEYTCDCVESFFTPPIGNNPAEITQETNSRIIKDTEDKARTDCEIEMT